MEERFVEALFGRNGIAAAIETLAAVGWCGVRLVGSAEMESLLRLKLHNTRSTSYLLSCSAEMESLLRLKLPFVALGAEAERVRPKWNRCCD